MAVQAFGQQLWHSDLVAVAVIASAVLLLFTAVAVPWLITRLPPDYFRRPGTPVWPALATKHPVSYIALRIAKNVLGSLLLVVGIALLFLPGQGILTILLALGLLDFPGKRRLERRIVSTPSVLRAVNTLRRRFGRPPMEVDSRP